MRILTDSEQRRIAELAESAGKIVDRARTEESRGRVDDMLETLRDMVVEASRIAHRKPASLKHGFVGTGQVEIPNVECELNESDTVYTVYRLTGEPVDVSALFLALGIGGDLEKAVWDDVEWQERRYGDVDFRIEQERAHG